MHIKDKLQIFLITYNRAACLDRTLAQVLGDDSPVRDFDITILDNASTDGTVDVIRKWQAIRPNLKHIRHNRNIGGNANCARATELANREYFWTICDDDDYDWTGWPELCAAIEAGEKIICVADYILNAKTRSLPEYQLFQMTFVPSIIAQTSLLTEACMKNIYDNVFAMFPQLVPIVMHLNAGGTIHVLDHPLVNNGMSAETDVSYVRGCKKRDDVFVRNRTMTWMVGYSNLLANIKDRSLARRCFTVPIVGDTSWRMGYWEFFAQTFVEFRGHENAMQLLDMRMQAGFVVRMVLRFIEFAQNTPLYALALAWRDRRKPR